MIRPSAHQAIVLHSALPLYPNDSSDHRNLSLCIQEGFCSDFHLEIWLERAHFLLKFRDYYQEK